MTSSHLRYARVLTLTLASIALSATVRADSTQVFFTNFDGGVPPEITGETIVQPVGGFNGLGNGLNVFSGDLHNNLSINGEVATRLTLEGLPPHNSIDINFLLAVIDSWEGTPGPDLLRISIDSAEFFSESFMNTNNALQSYVAPPMVELSYNSDLAFQPPEDAAYDMGLDPQFNGIPHTASTLVLSFDGEGAGYGGGAADESFGLDNLEVIVNSICTAMPAVGCLTGQGGSFQLKTKGGPLKYGLKWSLSKGDAFDQAAIGTPETTRQYTLCVYDRTAGMPELAGEVTIDPNSNWAANAPKGYKYLDKTGAEAGVQKAQFKTGAAGKTKVQISAKGANIPMPVPLSVSEFFDIDTSLTVQLINNETATCWTTDFTSAIKNDGIQFKAKQ
jgi:hypothetical protein